MKPRAVTLPSFFKTKAMVATYLFCGFCCAIALRIAIGQPDVSHSATAGLLFAACLLLLAAASGVKANISKRAVITGILGGLFLCVPAVIFHSNSFGSHLPGGNYVFWSLIVATVAFAEELFLRGALYDRIAAVSNQKSAIVFAAIAFAALHLPLYGWHALPLDFVVGLWLGSLRYSSGSYVAPGIAHILADLAAWWL